MIKKKLSIVIDKPEAVRTLISELELTYEQASLFFRSQRLAQLELELEYDGMNITINGFVLKRPSS